MSKKSNKKMSKSTQLGWIFAVFVLLLAGIVTYQYLWKFIGGNVTDKQEYLYVRTGWNFEELMRELKAKEILEDTATFREAAQRMKFRKIKPGKYRLKEGMSNRRLINMLKSGNQEPVKLNFQNIRLKEEFAGVIARQLEADSLSIIRLLDSTAFVKAHGFTNDEVYVMFLPNSYELYWNTNAEQFFERMYEEYQKFWTEKKKQRAEEIGLTPAEVSILASIVDSEALVDSEMPIIAGLYLNRLFIDMKLESDPTVIFASKDFSIRRVLNKHLQTVSPYNTYRNRGLPPGPISMPSIAAIDAVLNYKKHQFIYMCAKEDFSGYHNFAVTIAQHQQNARKFQQALNERNIRK
jgi:UPF0755 protein